MKTLINTPLPEFKLHAYHEGKFTEVQTADLKGAWSILFFYPADFSFVCPTELEDMAQSYAELREMGVEVYSISTDTHFTHKAWHDASPSIAKIRYPMLADPRGALTRAFGVHIEDEGLAHRGTFVINPEGLVKIAEIHDNGIGRNAEELLRKVRAAQFVAENPYEVCPARWQPGADTLRPGAELVGKL